MTDDHANIRRFLDISLNHLMPSTVDMLDETDVNSMPFGAARSRDGYFMWAGSDESSNGEYPDIDRCRSKAREMGCDYVLLDTDAPTLDGLPTYDRD